MIVDLVGFFDLMTLRVGIYIMETTASWMGSDANAFSTYQSEVKEISIQNSWWNV
jgi:hypothetical protein